MKISRLGIIAGGGSLPRQLADSCLSLGIEPFLVCFEGNTDPDFVRDFSHIWTTLGAAGKIMSFFKSHDVHDLVMIGHIKRPALSDVMPDWKGLQILSRIGLKSMGDNSLLTLLRKELEGEGFTLHGIQDFCEGLLISSGAVGCYEPNARDHESILVGAKASQVLGALDIGQSVVVQNGVVLGLEGVEGTDALITRCKDLQSRGRGAILVKTCKPQQDINLDLPTIGLQTLISAQKAGLVGIAVQANQVILSDPKTVAEYADRYKMFVYGFFLTSE